MYKHLNCKNCGGMQDFRRVRWEPEKEAIRADKGVSNVEAYWICTRKGCVRYQHYANAQDGGDLPEAFRN
ncbi:hypothetical protein [Streptomyces sp. NPDC052225]|uniref:hypothetical protein n=1 Tax=Streptomyces sp. NPDC052225 TaxID=3154949 RepID=UPI003440766B